MSVQWRWPGAEALHAQLLVSIVDSISACHAEDRGSIPRRGERVLFCCRTTHPKVFGAAGGHRRSSASTSARAKGNALAGNRTRVNCLEGSYAHHYTTNAGGGRRIARPVRTPEAHEPMLARARGAGATFGRARQRTGHVQGLHPVTYEEALSVHAG